MPQSRAPTPSAATPPLAPRAPHPAARRRRQAASSWPIFYFLCDLRRRYPRVLTRRHVAAATRYGTAAHYHYDRAHVAAPCRYVPIGLAMLGLLRASDAVSEAEYLVLLRRLKDLAFDAVVEMFPLPEIQEMKCQTDKNEKNVHLLPRDEHFHGAKVRSFYESSKYPGKKAVIKRCIKSA